MSTLRMIPTHRLDRQTRPIDNRGGGERAKAWPLYILSCILLSMALCVTALNAQTLFQPSDTTPAFSRYRSVEECLAAVDRVSDSVNRARPEFQDTMPFRTGAGRDSTPPVVIAIAQQCATSFNPDSVALTGAVETYTDWMRLYLTANRDAAAAVVARRRVTMAREHADTPNEVYDVLLEIMRAYGSAQPVRWDKVQETVVQLEAPGGASDSLLFRVYGYLFRVADAVADTIVMTKTAERMLVLGESPDLKDSPAFVQSGGKHALFYAVSFLTRAARLDSLRRGPDAYIAIERANWKRLTESLGFPIPNMIGEHALPVTGEFWFSSNNAPVTSSSDHPRPAPGKISLVVFFHQGCHERIPVYTEPFNRNTFHRSCWRSYAALRRLGERYPSLEITLVARTSGYSINTGPMSPPEEAAILQKWWLGFHRLPGTLAVSTTPFFRLEGIDRRRIDEPVPNDVNYSVGRNVGGWIPSGSAYLIDTNGAIIRAGALYHSDERTFTELLDVMMQRGK